jgi:hypothetical protein
VTQQAAVTVVAEVQPGQVDELRTLLGTMSADAGGNPILPLGALPGVHFARLLLLEETVDLDGAPLPARLIYLSDVDGSVGRHLGALVAVGGEGLDRLFGGCRGYPAPATPAGRLAFLRASLTRPDAAYVNTVGRTSRQILQEATLREALEGFLDGRDWSGTDPAEIRSAIEEFVAARPDLAWARSPAPGLGLVAQARLWTERVALVAVGLVLLPALVVVLPVLVVMVRIHERRELGQTIHDPASVPGGRDVREREDLVTQNPFSAVGYVKPGRFRRMTTTLLLRVVDVAARQIYNHGRLAGIRTIHFARWIFLDDKRRMLFASNYDGSLESYMDDFIDKVAWGLNAVFGNGVGYPPTRWLVLGGANDEEAFKAFLRSHQLPTQVWYSAYPRLTAANVENNAVIRAGLASTRSSPKEIAAWLARL